MTEEEKACFARNAAKRFRTDRSFVSFAVLRLRRYLLQDLWYRRNQITK